MRVKTAVIPAGGYGSRMQPITRAVPKPMLSVVCKPVIHYVVDEAVRAGIDHIVIVAGFRSDVIRNYFCRHTEYDSRSYGSPVLFEGTDIEVLEQVRPLGLADSIRCAEDSIGDGPFAVMLGDDIIRSEVPAIGQLCDGYSGRDLLGTMKVPRESASNYGVVVHLGSGGVFDVESLAEKPKEFVSDTACCGRYVFRRDTMDIFGDTYEANGVSAGIMDSMSERIERGPCPQGMMVEGRRFDTGNPEEFRRTLRAALDEGWE